MPITWRNVSGGSDATSARLMESAGQSFDGMFEGLGTVLDTKNQQLKTQDTEAFKQLLAQRYGNDPMALQQAQQSGELGSLRERFKYLDREKTGTDAINEMVTGLQQRAIQGQQYRDNQLQTGNRGARTDFYGRIADGDFDGAEALLGSRDWVNGSKMANALGEARNRAEQRRIEQEQWDAGHALDQAAARRQTQAHQMEMEKYRSGIEDQERAQQVDSVIQDLASTITRDTNATGLMKDLRTRLKGMKGVTTQDITKAEAALAGAYDRRTNLAEADRTYVDEKLAELEQNYNGQDMRGNYFNGWDPESAQDVTQRLADKYADEDGKFLGADGDTAVKRRNDVRRLAGNGLTIEGEDGTEYQIPVTEELLDSALSTAKNEGFLWDSYADIENRIKDVVLDDPNYRQQLDTYLQYEQDRKTYEKTLVDQVFQNKDRNQMFSTYTPQESPQITLPQGNGSDTSGNTAGDKAETGGGNEGEITPQNPEETRQQIIDRIRGSGTSAPPELSDAAKTTARQGVADFFSKIGTGLSTAADAVSNPILAASKLNMATQGAMNNSARNNFTKTVGRLANYSAPEKKQFLISFGHMLNDASPEELQIIIDELGEEAVEPYLE